MDLPKSLTIVTVHPNPFKTSSTVKVSAARPGPYGVKVYDDLGRIIRSFEIDIPANGQMPVSIDLSGQVSGVYKVQILETRTRQTAYQRVVLVE